MTEASSIGFSCASYTAARTKMRRRLAILAGLGAMLAIGGCSSTPDPENTSEVEGRDTVSNGLVISQVFGGGGNSGAPYTHDFIEIFNRGTVAISLGGKSLQYASSTQNFSST